MGQARGSAQIAAATTALVMMLTMPLLLFHCEAANYTVGGSKGWILKPDITSLNGKKLKVGDTLVFNYDKTQHNVARISNLNDYNSCKSTGATVKPLPQNGANQVQLTKGAYYFTCTIATHCKSSGMKLSITAD